MTITRMKFAKKDLPLSLEIETELGTMEIRVFKEFSEVPTMPTVTVNFSPEDEL